MSGQCLSPDVPGHALTPGTRRSLGGPLPHQQADRTWTAPGPPELCPREHVIPRGHRVLPALSQSPPTNRETPLFPCPGYVVHVFLTRSPLAWPPKGPDPFDLHALATPPAFVLSQDQTLQLKDRSNRRPPQRATLRDESRLTLTYARENASRPDQPELHRPGARQGPRTPCPAPPMEHQVL